MAIRRQNNRAARLGSLDPYSSSTRKKHSRGNNTTNIDDNGDEVIYLTVPRLYVNNLSYNVTWQDLKGLFRQEGEVVRAEVMSYSDSGRSKGCGLIEYSDINAAARALNSLNGVELRGRPIYVREDRETTTGSNSSRERVSSSRAPASRSVTSATSVSSSSGAGTRVGNRGRVANRDKGEDVIYLSTPRLYVNNLAWNVTWQDLKGLFRQEGNVLTADIMKGPDGRSKGCGLVEYSDINSAARALTSLNGVELRGRPIYVREDRETNDSSPVSGGAGKIRRSGVSSSSSSSGGRDRDTVVLDSPRLYVNNLPYDVSWQDVKDLFRKEGEVRRANIMTGPDGRSLGCAIVEFADIEGAARAVRALHDTDYGGRPLQVREDREDKKVFN